MEIEELLKIDPSKLYISSDLYINGTVYCITNEKPYLLKKGGTVFFVYEKNEKLRTALKSYQNNEKINCRDLCQCIKNLRADMALKKAIND